MSSSCHKIHATQCFSFKVSLKYHFSITKTMEKTTDDQPWCWETLTNFSCRLVLFCLNYILRYTWIIVKLQNIAGSIRPIWLEQKWDVFCIHFQFFVELTTKILVWLDICIKFSFLISNKIGFEYKNWIQLFGIFIFLKMNTGAFL